MMTIFRPFRSAAMILETFGVALSMNVRCKFKCGVNRGGVLKIR